jgi:hypothetical protein
MPRRRNTHLMVSVSLSAALCLVPIADSRPLPAHQVSQSDPDTESLGDFWNDNVGGMIHFYGGLSDGGMHFWTDEIPQKDGTKLKRHLQFIPSGKDKGRQFSQGSTDAEKKWKVE